MAEKRMFAKSIVLSDVFLDMPASARCLYFTLGMLADDEGFIGNVKSIMRQCSASQDDLAILLQKRYILGFDSGVIVIKHWKLNNYLQNDRIKPTTYQEELKQLTLDEKRAYTEVDSGMYTKCIQNVYIDKNSIVENSIDKNSIDNMSPVADVPSENCLDVNPANPGQDKKDMLSSMAQGCPVDVNPTVPSEKNLVDEYPYQEILDYLSKKAKRQRGYIVNHERKRTIRARFKEGYSKQDFFDVIDIKTSQWLNDTKMNKYLCPETLFAQSKFDKYLNEVPVKSEDSVVYSDKNNPETTREEVIALGVFRKNTIDEINKNLEALGFIKLSQHEYEERSTQ